MQRMAISKKNIFSREDIRQWERSLRSLPIAIDKNEQQILKHQEELVHLREKLNLQVKDIQQNNEKIKGLKSRIEMIEKNKSIVDLKKIEPKNSAEMAKLTPQIVLFDSTIKPFNEEIEMLSRFIKIKQFQASLEDATAKEKLYEERLGAEKKSLAIRRTELASVVDDLSHINSNIAKLELYLERLDAVRKERVNSAKINLEREVKEWERQAIEHKQREISHQAYIYAEQEKQRDKCVLRKEHEWQLILRREDESRALERPEQERKENMLSKFRVQLQTQLTHKNTLLSDIAESEKTIKLYEYNVRSARNAIYTANTFLSSIEMQVLHASNTNDLSTFTHQKTQCLVEKTKLEDQRDNLIREVKRLEKEMYGANHLISQYQQRLIELAPIAMPYETLDYDDLFPLLEVAKQEQVILEKAKLVLESAIAMHTTDISNFKTIISGDRLSLKKLGQEEFLILLRDNSQKLLDTLAEEMEVNFKEFDNSNPVDQAEEVRICLVEKDKIIQHILSDKAGFKLGADEQPGEAKSIFEQNTIAKYYQLCGYLRRIQTRIGYPEKNKELGDRIESILGDKILKPSECLEAYMAAQIPEMHKKDLILHIHHEYKKAKNMLENELLNVPEGSKHYNDFYSKGRIVLDTVCADEDQIVKQDTGSSFNYGLMDLNRRILQKTYAVLKEPENVILSAECKKLASMHRVGQPSRCKKIIGAIMMFLGAALCIAGIVGKIASLGLEPVVTSVAIGVGAGLFIGGLSLFSKNRNKMEHFVKAAEKVKKEPILESTTEDSSPYSTMEATYGLVEPSAPSYYALSAS